MRRLAWVCMVLCVAMIQIRAVYPQETTGTDRLGSAPEVLWRSPQDIGSRDLFNGPRGPEGAPQPPFEFLREDMDGSNPKFDVRDANGVHWRVKLGIEAKPETAASRILWSVGYFVPEMYFVPKLKVENLPELKRGQSRVEPGGVVRNVRLKRHQKKLDTWKWKDNPFVDTREFNGLRVMMALLNNWDLKDINTAVYKETNEAGETELHYLVSDLGGSLSETGRSWPVRKAKGNLDKYAASKFIDDVTDDQVDFATPSRPEVHYVVDLRDFLHRVKMRWIGKGIPIADARWVGGLLAQLSPDQIRDAFRAAGYRPAAVEGFTQSLLERIDQLRGL